MKNNEIEFWRRFYAWSIADWHREINQGLPFLGSLNSGYLRALLSELCDEEIADFAKAMVKSGIRPELQQELGLTTTNTDRYYHDLYMRKWNEALFTDPLYKKLERAARDKVHVATFKKSISMALAPLLGTEFDDIEGWKVWRYVNEMGPWKIHTIIQIGDDQLSYEQSVFCGSIYLLKQCSLLRWLGLSAGTEWGGLTNSDIPYVSETLAKLIDHFINALQKLLENVTPE